MITLSIIVPVYNATEYIVSCIDSIVNQNPKKIEVIIVNDGSTDNSGAIADSYAHNYDYIRVIHQKNQGVSAARNIALVAAKGCYLVFLDADDVLYADFFKQTFKLMKEQPDIIEIDADIISKTNELIKKGIFSLEQKCTNSDNTILAKIRLVQQSKYYLWARIIRREMVTDLRFEENIRFCEDALYVTECYFRAQNIVALNNSLYGYRQHIKSVTITQNTRNINQLAILCNLIFNKLECHSNKKYIAFYLDLLVNLIHLRKSMYALHYKIIACDRVTLTNIQKIKKYSEWPWLKSESNVHWLRRLSILAPKSSNILILLKSYLKYK